MIFIPAVQPLVTGSPVAWCFAFVDGKLLLPEARARCSRSPAASRPLAPAPLPGTLDASTAGPCSSPAPDRLAPMPLRAAMMQFPEPLWALAGRAAQVLEWDRAHRFCGVCGTPTELQAPERARNCPACGTAPIRA